MKYFIFAVLAVFSVSSYAVIGKIDVKSGSLRVKRADGFKVNFYQGQYDAALNIGKGSAVLTIMRNGIQTDATVKYPKGTKIPDNGAFTIDGLQTGQTFKIDGTIKTDQERSRDYRDHESCTYYREVYVCDRYGCWWETVAYHGYRSVEFYYLIKTVTVATSIDSNNGSQVTFGGNDTEKKKVYTHVGECY